tara:strand:+ start:2843 stop:3187 length:345 start_codon:yes stop_codon:yes gene_type:complete
MNEEQKVKLCYTVNFEEVPAEISKFLQKSLDLNKRVAADLEVAKQKTSASSVELALNSVLSARAELIKIDQVLEDVADLLTGYKQALKDLQQKGLDSVAKTIETLKERSEESDE